MALSKPKRAELALLPVIFALAWPTMLEQMLGTMVQYIDTAMVGSLGTAATAAVGTTTTINWLVGSSTTAMGTGFLAYISQALGAGDGDRARRVSAQSVFVVLATGLFFTALTLGLSGVVPVWMNADESIRGLASAYFFILYIPMLPRTASIIFSTVLRAAGDSKTPMRSGIVVNILNVILNYLLIYPVGHVVLFGMNIPTFGLGWGVVGAAAASAIAYAVGGIIITVVYFRHRDISPRGESIRPNKAILIPCMRISLPNMLQRFCSSSAYVVYASMINALGGLSTAAHTIANTVESFFYIPGYGMSTAAATLTGNCIGAGDEQRREAMSRMIVLSEVAMMTAGAAVLFGFADKLTMLFSQDPEVIRLSARVLRMVALSEPFYGIMIVTEGMLMGAGETVRPFIFNVSGMWLIRIVGTFICTSFFGMGLVAAWACMIAGNMCTMVMFWLYFRSGKWRRIKI